MVTARTHRVVSNSSLTDEISESLATPITAFFRDADLGLCFQGQTIAKQEVKW